MLYNNITGPLKGGLNTTYDTLPYYPISVREKLSKKEVQPLHSLTKSEAIELCIQRRVIGAVSIQ